MASQQQASSTPLHIRDRLRTPHYVFDYLNRLYKFDVDLCAENEDSALCEKFISPEDNGLLGPWMIYGSVGWCNPPYSEQRKWIEKAVLDMGFGFTTVMLLPVFNGQSYWPYIYDNAISVTNIIGRISFIAPEDYTIAGKNGKPDRHIRKGKPIGSNTSGSCIVVFGQTNILSPYVYRDSMINDRMEELL